MIRKTKIQLLPREIEMACNAEIILTKNTIIQKLKSFLEELLDNQQLILQEFIHHLPSEVLRTPAKISRGENYKGLPWLVLDYPRHFEAGNIFAIRTLFWWGNFFSTTLHLSGRYKQQVEKNILTNLSLLMKHDGFICIAEHEWEHHLEETNYKFIRELDIAVLTKTIEEKSFLKLAIKSPLGATDAVEDKLCRSYEILLKACC